MVFHSIDTIKLDQVEEWVATTVLEKKISLTDCVYLATQEFSDAPASLLLLAFASFVAALDGVEDSGIVFQSKPSQDELTFCLLALVVDVAALDLSSANKASCLDLRRFWLVTKDSIFGPSK